MRRKKGLKRTIFLVTVLIVIISTFSSVITANAWGKKDKIPIPNVQKDIYVYDEDNIIEDNIENEINTLLIQLESKTTAEVAVITVESLLDMEIEDYSYELANTLGIGKAKEDNGVLLLISKSDKRVRLEIGTGLEGCLNDSKCGRILDDYFVPYREKDKYSEGTYKTIEAVVAVIAKEYNTTVGDVDNVIADEISQREKEHNKKVFTIIVIIIIAIIILFVCDNIFWEGVLLDFICDVAGSSGGSSGGGFGGGGFSGGGASR